MVLFGATNGSGTRMNSGTYVYDFDFHLPKILPSSFDGTYGWIRYSIKGIVDLPMKFDLEEKRFFRLISPIDFNQLSNNLQVKRLIFVKMFHIICKFVVRIRVQRKMKSTHVVCVALRAPFKPIWHWKGGLLRLGNTLILL